MLALTIVELLAVIALLSSAGPVRRSLRVDPLTAQREDWSGGGRIRLLDRRSLGEGGEADQCYDDRL